MAPRNAIRSFLSLLLMIPMMLLTGLTACSKSKTSGGTAAALAPIQGEGDASAAGGDDDTDEASSKDDCDKDDELASEDEGKEEEYEDEDAEKAALKADKANKGKKTKKECPVPGSTPTAPAATGTASLAEGQKLYAANCQGCHGALPGEKQGSSAASILSASGVGAHKGITPWPAGAGSTLSAQDAAASLAAAMK